MNPGCEIERKAVCESLRLLHAERAEKLAMLHWDTPNGNQRFHLIDDPDLREAFGPIIGRVAYSHWWPIDRVAKEFHAISGAQAGFPQTWTVDALKLACILRCADFAHIDERRAPAFLRALRKPDGSSDDHWKFQAKLYQPRLEGDRLIFTAKSAFTIDEASAWWICYDTLSGIDSELRKVDSLLADMSRERFAAKGVSQAEEPSRVAKLIKTEGWQPVDTRIRVSAVADLVSKLGGKDLYGDNTTPPLREMVQNAADAVRARRLLDDRSEDWGEVRIRFGSDDSGSWIQVEDSGVGMSEAVLTGPLLDFGTSFWSSTMMHDQLPGLAAKGFEATGRYGIGFFSVFMWGQRVEVTTQRFDKGREDTLVLSFKKGLKERPLLRPAQAIERILDGGTRVKVWFSDASTLDRIVAKFDDKKLSFAQACARIAPCVDVTIKVAGSDGNYETAVLANDWLTISDDTLLARIAPLDMPKRLREDAPYFEKTACPALKILCSPEGRVLGRAAIWRWQGYYSSNSKGIVAVGGFRSCSLAGIVGVLLGRPTRASRDVAVPALPVPILKEWTALERDSRVTEGHPQDALERIAQVVCALGVDTGSLPIARGREGWITLAKLLDGANELDEVLLVHDASVSIAERNREPICFHKNVFAVSMGLMSVVNSESRSWIEWPSREDHESKAFERVDSRSPFGVVIRGLSVVWKTALDKVLAVSLLDTDDERTVREIGLLEGKPFKENVYIIRRPKPNENFPPDDAGALVSGR